MFGVILHIVVSWKRSVEDKSGKEIKEDKKGSRELVLSVGCDVYVLTKAECII